MAGGEGGGVVSDCSFCAVSNPVIIHPDGSGVEHLRYTVAELSRDTIEDGNVSLQCLVNTLCRVGCTLTSQGGEACN